MTGTVKFFNDSKGFGFITNEETGKDITNVNKLVYFTFLIFNDLKTST